MAAPATTPPVKKLHEHPAPDASRHRNASGGFTLVEVTIVLMIIGLIIAVGVSSWFTLLETRRLAATRSTLEAVKTCLVTRVVQSQRYPTWDTTTGGNEFPGANCDEKNFDVENCMCPKTDGFSHPIRYIAGVDDANTPLNGQYVLDDEAKNQTAAVIDPALTSVTDRRGATVEDVAFVLVSYGSDGLADNTSYGDDLPFNRLAPGAQLLHNEPPTFRLAEGLDAAGPVDFSGPSVAGDPYDDVILIVTTQELKALVK